MTSRIDITAMLQQRGVDNIELLLTEYAGKWGDDLDPILGAIEAWDERPGARHGLLVRMIHDGGRRGWRPVGERDRPQGDEKAIAERLLQAVRGQCASPDGCTREEARSTFEDAAERRGLTADALIDLAMGSDWRETPVSNPLHDRTDDDPESRRIRYGRWVIRMPDVTEQEIADERARLEEELHDPPEYRRSDRPEHHHPDCRCGKCRGEKEPF